MMAEAGCQPSIPIMTVILSFCDINESGNLFFLKNPSTFPTYVP